MSVCGRVTWLPAVRRAGGRRLGGFILELGTERTARHDTPRGIDRYSSACINKYTEKNYVFFCSEHLNKKKGFATSVSLSPAAGSFKQHRHAFSFAAAPSCCILNHFLPVDVLQPKLSQICGRLVHTHIHPCHGETDPLKRRETSRLNRHCIHCNSLLRPVPPTPLPAGTTHCFQLSAGTNDQSSTRWFGF